MCHPVEYTSPLNSDHEATDPDWSPSDVVAIEELLHINAVCNETLKRYCAHLDSVSEYDQLITDTVTYDTIR